MRKIYHSDVIAGKQVRVYGRDIFGEFVVRTYDNGQLLVGSCYFTSDKEDALEAAAYIVKALQQAEKDKALRGMREPTTEELEDEPK